MIPTTRDQFKLFCLRELGYPVIQINLSDDIIDDRIDEAIGLYQEFHQEGSQQVLYKYIVQPQDITNNYITLPSNMIGVTRIFPLYSDIATNSIFNVRYQIALNDLYTLTNVDIVPYFMAMQHLAQLEEVLVGVPPIRFNKMTNILYIDTDWSTVQVGYYILVEGYMTIDPDQYPAMYNDNWLQRYATALIKKSWANVLKKYNGLTMPGGIKFDGKAMFDEAVDEIKLLRDELNNVWSVPISIFIG